MLICEAQKIVKLCTPEIKGCHIGEFLPMCSQPHVLLAPVKYNFVVALDVHEVAMHGNEDLQTLIRTRIKSQLLSMLDNLEDPV